MNDPDRRASANRKRESRWRRITARFHRQGAAVPADLAAHHEGRPRAWTRREVRSGKGRNRKGATKRRAPVVKAERRRRNKAARASRARNR